MGKSVNKAIILGNVGRDPDYKMTRNGSAYVTFSIATSERRKDQSGEWVEFAEWHNCIAYGKLADIIREHVSKGSKLYAEGRLRTNSWEDRDSGKKQYRTEIVVDEVTLIGGPRGEQHYAQDEHSQASPITDADIPF